MLHPLPAFQSGCWQPAAHCRAAGTAAMGSGEGGKHPDTSSCWARAAVQGSIHPALLLALLWLLGMPTAHGACGPPPPMTHSQPSSVEQLSSFPVGSRVTYMCLRGAIRIPGALDTVQCLPGSYWSELRDPCGLSCATPTSMHFAALSEVDEMINFYPVGFTVSYVCRPGYENISESQPTSTCLESLTWSEVPELCQRKSCGPPEAPPAGRILQPTDFLFGTHVNVLCDEGYQLHGRNFIRCWLKGDDVEWSELPTCELITCSSPPRISNGRHDGEGVEKFAYNSTVTYSCDSGFQLIGNVSIRCTRAENARGVWSGAVPQCKEKSPPVKLGIKPMERSPPPQGSQRRDLKPPKKTFTMEMKMSLYKKSLQNTNSFSSSSSFSRKPGSCATSALKFVMPLYKTQSSFSPGTHKQSPCSPKYRSISAVFPKAGCSENTWWSKAAAFCGKRSWAARRTWTWQKCCYHRFPIRCKRLFYL
ncbi:complement decay-accelerating factor-like isoform X2 [Lagopus muta]|uniref:complement decay-accelerating factor-like isoform X2 n=1 Tax=Lagopus muta TaxID=64668 RepID=UPI0020A15E82|nr:complement decay-accelerating factor-like isoform X2 [Lagopus muta]